MATFNRPTLKDIRLEDCCIKTIKNIDEKYKAGSTGASWLAWSPFFSIITDLSSPSIIFTILSTDWEGLANTIKGLEKIKHYSIAQECSLEAAKHLANTKLKDFWNAMYNFHKSQGDSM